MEEIDWNTKKKKKLINPRDSRKRKNRGTKNIGDI